MADPITQILEVSLPGAGQTSTYTLTAGTPVKFAFDLSEAVFTGVNGNLEIAIEGGGTVILENYRDLAESGTLPQFTTMEGEEVAGDVYLFAFEDAEETAEGLETAADAAGGGSGAGEYSDDAGNLFDGLDALGGQGDAYDPRAVIQLADILGNAPPVAIDDESEDVLEDGDQDLVPGKYVNWVEGPFYEPETDAIEQITVLDSEAYQAYLHANLIGWDPDYEFDPQYVTYLPLAGEQGGILIYNPNPPQEPYEVSGDVMANDFDPDGDPITMNTIDYDGLNYLGVDETPVAVSGPTAVIGRYGVLLINPDGSYVYTLNQEWADELNEGETFDEIFLYNIVDPLGQVSNTATLTVTVFGSNDMPVAHADFNVEAVEDGDSESYALYATVLDSDLNEGEGGTVTVHDDEEHDFRTVVNTTGNVLAGDDAGGVTDTDPDSGDQAGDGTLFVVGVYSNYTETVSFVTPGEAGSPPPDYGPAMHPDQYWDIATIPTDATVTVSGHYGVLTIEADGDYTYTLYGGNLENGEERVLNGAYSTDYMQLLADLDALNYDNPGQDDFTYGIMDDSGAFSYATISFTVNGANDAPVAAHDVAEVVEFGAEHFYALGGIDETDQGEIDAVSTVIGNVLANDEDVDNADLVNESGETPEVFVADVYTKNEGGSIKDMFDVFNDTDTSDGTTAQQVILQGLYGTLTINADGSYSYVVDNDNPTVNVLNVEQTLTDTFYYTARNAYEDGVISNEATLDITINGTNDAPTDADFFVAADFDAEGDIVIPFSAFGNHVTDTEGGIVIPFSKFDDHITDPEDDHTGTDSSFRIESLPEGGTLYYNGVAVEVDEVYNLGATPDHFTYMPDEGTQKGVLLGSRLRVDAELDTWGDKIDNQTREMELDLDDDTSTDVVITTSIDSNKLKVYDHQANHIGHGLANKTHNGIDMGETLTVDFNGTAVAFAKIGFDGLGNYFNPDSQQDAHATWVAYNGSTVVAWGMVNNDQMFVGTGDVPTDHAEWKTAAMVSDVPDGTPGNQGDLFQSFILDQSILNGEVFDKIEFGTTEAGPRDWNSNWELRYVDVEFAGNHTFTYTAVDSNSQDDIGIYDGPATVTILPSGPFNEAPEAHPDLLVTNEDAAPSHGSVGLNDIDFDDTAHELTFVLNDPEPMGLTFNPDGTYTFDPSSYQYLSQGENVTFVLNYTVYDNGVPVGTDDTTLTITVEGINDPPVAGNDFYHEVFVRPASSEIVTTEETLGGQGGWTGAHGQQSVDYGDIEVWATAWGVPHPLPGFTLVAPGNSPHLRIKSPGEPPGTSDIDAHGIAEQIGIRFDNAQTDVTLNLGHLNAGGHLFNGFKDADKITFLIYEEGNALPRVEIVLIDPHWGHPPNDPSFEFTSTSGITKIEIRPMLFSKTEFTLLSVDYTTTTTVTDEGAIYYEDIYEDDGLVGNAAGNVLANDYDVDSNPLEVLKVKLQGGSWTNVEAAGTVIAGIYGDLRIFENGEYTYELRPSVLELDEVPESETFVYRVTDLDGGADTAKLSFQIHDMSDPNFAHGTPNADTLTGSGEGDSLFGLAGDDMIYGGAGADLISGGSGDDTLHGEGGRDTLYGGEGDDVLRGSSARDIIWGGEGDDQVYGGGGNDKIYVSEGADTIHVSSGDDTVVIDPAYIGEGGANATIVNFESGNDMLKLGDLTGKDVFIDEVADDLQITFSNPGGGTPEADIVVTLDGVSLSQFDGVDISDNTELNQMIQEIIDSGGTIP